jgi:flagella basal body P-ring formation protein FlgA
MRSFLFAAAVASAALPGSGSAAEYDLTEGQVQIELRAQVVANRRDVKLGDVAIVRTRDYLTIERLVALPLGSAPRAGTEAVLRRDVIARWIRSQLGIARDQILWSGSDEIHVRSTSQQITAARIESAARRALQEWLGPRHARYGFEAAAVPEFTVPAGHALLAVRPLGGTEPADRTVVWVDVEVDGHAVRAVPVTFAVTAKVERPATAAVSRSIAAPVTAEPATAARTAAVAPAPPLVVRGEWVVLQLKSGAVELERRAQVLQDGALGQVIKVRGENGSSPMNGRVTAAGRVEALL